MAAPYPKVGTRGTGRRKEAIVRVRLVPGNGTVIINGKSMEQYLGNRKALHIPVKQPLIAAGVEERFNVLVNATGGGIVGQSVAIRMGVARALSDINPDSEGHFVRSYFSAQRFSQAGWVVLNRFFRRAGSGRLPLHAYEQ